MISEALVKKYKKKHAEKLLEIVEWAGPRGLDLTIQMHRWLIKNDADYRADCKFMEMVMHDA